MTVWCGRSSGPDDITVPGGLHPFETAEISAGVPCGSVRFGRPLRRCSRR